MVQGLHPERLHVCFFLSIICYTNSSEYWNATHFKWVPVGVTRTKNISRARNYVPTELRNTLPIKMRLLLDQKSRSTPVFICNTLQVVSSGMFNDFEFQQIVLTATDEKNWLHTRVQDLDYGWSIVKAIYRYYNSHIAVCENLGIVGCFMIDMLSQILVAQS